MPRLIAIFALFTFTLASIFAPLAAIHPGTILIGGEYTVQPGEVRHGNLIALLARVKIAAGGEVTGQVRVFGGELEISGCVGAGLQSFGSQINVEPTAQISGEITSMDYLKGRFFLPSILLVIS